MKIIYALLGALFGMALAYILWVIGYWRISRCFVKVKYGVLPTADMLGIVFIVSFILGVMMLD